MSIWLDSESFLPLRYDMDMSEIMSAYMQASLGETEGVHGGRHHRCRQHPALKLQRHRQYRKARGHSLNRKLKAPARTYRAGAFSL